MLLAAALTSLPDVICVSVLSLALQDVQAGRDHRAPGHPQQPQQGMAWQQQPGSAPMAMQQHAHHQHAHQQQQQQLQSDWPYVSEPHHGAFASAVDHASVAAAAAGPAPSHAAHRLAAPTAAGAMAAMAPHATAPGAALSAASAAAGGGDASAAAAAALAAAPLSVVRLPMLAQHLPAGGQLELLIMGEAGLVGVLFRLGQQQQRQQQLVSR
jgi:hypothetical protein